MLHSLWDFTVSEHMHVIIDADELCTNDHHQLHLRHFFFFLRAHRHVLLFIVLHTMQGFDWPS